MPETLPGNPTEAGPDTRSRKDPPPMWDDWMIYAETELSNSRRDRRASTREDRRYQLEAIARAETFLECAKAVLREW